MQGLPKSQEGPVGAPVKGHATGDLLEAPGADGSAHLSGDRPKRLLRPTRLRRALRPPSLIGQPLANRRRSIGPSHYAVDVWRTAPQPHLQLRRHDDSTRSAIPVRPLERRVKARFDFRRRFPLPPASFVIEYQEGVVEVLRILRQDPHSFSRTGWIVTMISKDHGVDRTNAERLRPIEHLFQHGAHVSVCREHDQILPAHPRIPDATMLPTSIAPLQSFKYL